MKKMMLLAALVAVTGFGCKKKKAEEAPMTGSSEGSGSAMMGSGSSAMAGSGSAGSAAMAKPMTGEEMAAQFQKCWGYFNDAKWDDFKGCYTSDAVNEAPGSGVPANNGPDAIVSYVKTFKDAFPDMKGEAVLVLVSGHDIAAVSWVHGTQTGALKTPMGEIPATKNKVGFLLSQWLEMDDSGKAKVENEYWDMATLLGQIKPDPKHPVRPVMDKAPMPTQVVVAKDDDQEKKELEADKKDIEAFNKHDEKAFLDGLTADATWYESPDPKDLNRKELEAQIKELFKAFPDVKIEATKSIAAGTYVAAVGTWTGTNEGDFPMMKLKKTGKKVTVPLVAFHEFNADKIKSTWIFWQGMAFAQQLGMMPAEGAAPAGEGSGSAAAPAKGAKKGAAPKKG